MSNAVSSDSYHCYGPFVHIAHDTLKSSVLALYTFVVFDISFIHLAIASFLGWLCAEPIEFGSDILVLGSPPVVPDK